MAYNEFAYFYDEFNGAADYEALYTYITNELRSHGVEDGIVADLGCGTGELTLMLAQAGYDMIGIDRSEEMLSVLRDKADAIGMTGRILLLRQDLLYLDLYGTIRAAVSTFDTYNHIGPLENFEKAIAKAAFFMEKDGVFVFDLNTPYKHREILAEQTFDFDEEDASCRWTNHCDEATGRVNLSIDIHYKDTDEDFHEEFSEYSYSLNTVTDLLERYGFKVVKLADGEDFGPVREDSPRWIFTAVKQYTQEEKEDHV
ncbi:MAG: class I SAM-dependent methyltransferase [Oscillospiraceae bacterium]|nr:class I SAM-dependent methyltransferase [Oscillospiraceae bacterium]